MELPPIASHLMLDHSYTSNSDFHHHRRTPSASSTSSSIHSGSSFDFSGLSESAYPFHSSPNSDVPSTFVPSRPLAKYPNEQTISPDLSSSSYHNYRHSSQSSDGSSPPLFGHESASPPPISAERWNPQNQRPQKRISSIRNSRNESSPYPSQHSSDGYASDRSSDLPDYLVNSMKLRGDASETDESDWGDSRRSSMSSTSWSSYDPSMGADPSLLYYEEPGIHTYHPTLADFGPGQLGHIGILSSDGIQSDDGRSVEETKIVLERFAHAVKTAGTTSAQDRARGAFVQAWLGHSYSRHLEGNVSRQGLYGSYLKSCATYGVRAINSASFGKAVRQKFPDIKTRRLGVRGASRYHYCGIRPANSAEASLLASIAKEAESNNSPDDNADDASIEIQDVMSGEDRDEKPPPRTTRLSIHNEPQPMTPTTARPKNPDEPHHPHTRSSRRPQAARSLSISVPQTINFGESEKTLGGGLAKSMQAPIVIPNVIALPGFPQIEEALVAAGMSLNAQQASEFWSRFVGHCNKLLEVIRSYRFDQLELHVRTWWANLDEGQRAIVQHPLVSPMLYRADAIIYAEILDFLHLQILINMPPQAFASLRGLADNMERIQSVALEGFRGLPFPGPKVELAARFGHLVTRHLGLCQLAQALTGIVSNPKNLAEMAQAWDLIDFESIKNQSALVSNCQHETLESCFEGFKALLANPGPAPIERFIQFGDQFFARCISPMFGNSQGPNMSPRSLLIRWSFVSSQIMRDLTLRSAPTFGSFAIASTFFNEFLGFQVLRRVALQISAIATPTPAPVQQTFLFSSPADDPLMPYSMHHPSNSPMSIPNGVGGGGGGHLYSFDSMMKVPSPSFDSYNSQLVAQFDPTQSVALPQPYPNHSPQPTYQHAHFVQEDNDPHLSEPMSYGSAFDVGNFGSTSPTSSSLSSVVQQVGTGQNPTQDLTMMEVERFGDLRFSENSPATSVVASPGESGLTPASS